MRKMKRQPTHPGKIIKEDYLTPLSITIKDIAELLGISRKTLSKLLMKEALFLQIWRYAYPVPLILHLTYG